MYNGQRFLDDLLMTGYDLFINFMLLRCFVPFIYTVIHLL